MSQSSKREQKKRSRAITAIIKTIGRDKWNKIPVEDKKILIKEHIVKTKKETEKGRNYIKNLNKQYRGKYQKSVAA